MVSEVIQLAFKRGPSFVLEFNPEPAPKVELVRAIIGKTGAGIPQGGFTDNIPRKQSEKDFDIAWSKPPSLFTTPPLPIVNGRIQLPSKPLGGLFLDMALVFVDLKPEDILENGLLTNKDYIMEEHINVIVDGDFAVFVDSDESLVGKYAKVSYLTWPEK